MVLPAGFVPGSGGTRRAVGRAGLAVLVIGAVLVALSFTVLNWVSASGVTIKFKDLHDAANQPGAPQVPHLYFSWLGWALLAGVVVFGIAGALPSGMHPLFRVLGILAGFGGVVVTFFALYSHISLTDLLKHAGIGFWVALAGFFLAGIGAVVGPRRVRI
jgi:hypothetical protein